MFQLIIFIITYFEIHHDCHHHCQHCSVPDLNGKTAHIHHTVHTTYKHIVLQKNKKKKRGSQ